MDVQAVRDIVRRLDRLETTAVRYRQGVVTDLTPLSVALGGSDIPFVDVKTVAGLALAVNDVVAVLMWGNDLIVLGAVGDGS